MGENFEKLVMEILAGVAWGLGLVMGLFIVGTLIVIIGIMS